MPQARGCHWMKKKTQPYPGDPLRVDLGQRRREKLRPVLSGPCRRRGEPAGVLGARRPEPAPHLIRWRPRGRSDRAAPTAAICPPGQTVGRARLDPSGLTPGRLFGERGSILCSRSRVRGTGTLQVSRHETLEKPETASIVTRASGRREGFRRCSWPSRRNHSRRVSSAVAPMPQTPKPAHETAPGPTTTATDSR